MLILVLDKIIPFGDFPLWVQRRLSLIVRDIKKEKFNFYIESLSENEYDCTKNHCIAVFLTDEEFVKAQFGLDSMSIEKNKLSNLSKVTKGLAIPIEDSFKNADVQWQSVILLFSDLHTVTIHSPQISYGGNLEAYKQLISKF